MTITLKHDEKGRAHTVMVSTTAEQLAGQAILTSNIISRVSNARDLGGGNLYVTPLDGIVLDAALRGYLAGIVAESAKDAALTPAEDTSRE